MPKCHPPIEALLVAARRTNNNNKSGYQNQSCGPTSTRERPRSHLLVVGKIRDSQGNSSAKRHGLPPRRKKGRDSKDEVGAVVVRLTRRSPSRL